MDHTQVGSTCKRPQPTTSLTEAPAHDHHEEVLFSHSLFASSLSPLSLPVSLFFSLTSVSSIPSVVRSTSLLPHPTRHLHTRASVSPGFFFFRNIITAPGWDLIFSRQDDSRNFSGNRSLLYIGASTW